MTVPRVLVVRRENAADLSLSVLVDARSDGDVLCRELAGDLCWLQARRGGTGRSVGDELRGHAGPLPGPLERRRSPRRSPTSGPGASTSSCSRAPAPSAPISPFDGAAHRAPPARSYPSCATFWLGRADSSFVGATPEPLVRLEGRVAYRSAIAGSIARGTTPGADGALAAALLASAKDRREHASSCAPIRDCARAAVRPPRRRRSAAGARPRQRAAPAHADPRPASRRAARLLDLVDRLHPTPAVAGHPRAAALARAARARERSSAAGTRGPVGWIGRRRQRRARRRHPLRAPRGDRATLYAGAGIVAGSRSEAELAETRLKLQPLLSALMEV